MIVRAIQAMVLRCHRHTKQKELNMLEKLEEKYGLMMKRSEVMEVLNVSLSTIKRMEIKGKLVRIPNQGKLAKFSTELVAKIASGENDES